jgi:RNA polymerase sigma factor (sigma-70 family)
MADSWSDRSLEELQHLFAEGDPAALSELLSRHEGRLRACARVFAGGHVTVAEESYADFALNLSRIVAKAASGEGTYRPTQPWLPWAKKILHHAVYDQLRTLRRGGVQKKEPEDLQAKETATQADARPALAEAVWEVFRPLIEQGDHELLPDSPGEPVNPDCLPPEIHEEVLRFRDALRTCLQRLAEEDRQLLAERFWGKKRSHQYEGIASATIRKRLQLARETLRRCVSQQLPEVRS